MKLFIQYLREWDRNMAKLRHTKPMMDEEPDPPMSDEEVEKMGEWIMNTSDTRYES